MKQWSAAVALSYMAFVAAMAIALFITLSEPHVVVALHPGDDMGTSGLDNALKR
jgi:hypothetical protein